MGGDDSNLTMMINISDSRGMSLFIIKTEKLFLRIMLVVNKEFLIDDYKFSTIFNLLSTLSQTTLTFSTKLYPVHSNLINYQYNNFICLLKQQQRSVKTVYLFLNDHKL